MPKFAVKEGADYAALDYYRHLVSKVDASKFDYASIAWDLSDMLARAKDSLYRVTIDQGLQRVDEHEAVGSEDDEQVMAWLVASLSFDYFSFKKLRVIVENVVEQLLKKNKKLKDNLSLIKFELRQRVSGFIERETDRIAHGVFDRLFTQKKLCFYLECVDTRFEIPPKVEVRSKTRKLTPDDGDQIQQSLFDIVPDDLNDYEKAVALYLDTRPQVLWWYRNLVGPDPEVSPRINQTYQPVE